MNNFLEPVTKALFDPEARMSSKAAIFVLIVVLLFVVDGLMGYSYYYHSSKKVEQVSKMSALLKDSSLDEQARNSVRNMRQELLDQRRFSDKVALVMKDINIYRAINPTYTKDGKLRSFFWFHLTAGGFFYIICLLYLPSILFGGHSSMITNLATSIFFTLYCFAMGYFLSWLLSFIPPLSISSWFWNYVLNVVLQGGVLVGASFVSEGIEDEKYYSRLRNEGK